VRYITYRSREQAQEERTSFDAKNDRADVKAFNDRLEDPVNRHHMATKAYKITFSLSRDEFQKTGLESWKPVIREAMANLEARWGKQLDWIASEHRTVDHPHCHVVVRAGYTDSTGRSRQLRINREQLKGVRREVGRIVAREKTLHRDPGAPERGAKGISLGREFDVWSSVISAFCKAIEESARKAKRERERAEQERCDRDRERERER
jgi:hypothetical protein